MSHDSLARFKRAQNPDREMVLHEFPNGEKAFMSLRDSWTHDALVEKEKQADPVYGRDAMAEIMGKLNQNTPIPRSIEEKK